MLKCCSIDASPEVVLSQEHNKNSIKILCNEIFVFGKMHMCLKHKDNGFKCIHSGTQLKKKKDNFQALKTLAQCGRQRETIKDLCGHIFVSYVDMAWVSLSLNLPLVLSSKKIIQTSHFETRLQGLDNLNIISDCILVDMGFITYSSVCLNQSVHYDDNKSIPKKKKKWFHMEIAGARDLCLQNCIAGPRSFRWFSEPTLHSFWSV